MPIAKEITLKSADEIQRAHDLLLPIVTFQVPIQVKEETRMAIHAALDVLCWVLQHEHNTTFSENLAYLESELAEQGFSLRSFDAEAWREPADGYPSRGELVQICLRLGAVKRARWDEPFLMMWTDEDGRAWYHPEDVFAWRPLDEEKS